MYQYAEQQYPSLEAYDYPMAHVANLPKANGDNVTAVWAVANSGGVAGFARLSVGLAGQAVVLSVITAVPAGGQVSVARALLVSGQPDGATVNGTVELFESDSAGNFIRSLGLHTFSIQTPAPAPAVLSAVGNPTIT